MLEPRPAVSQLLTRCDDASPFSCTLDRSMEERGGWAPPQPPLRQGYLFGAELEPRRVAPSSPYQRCPGGRDQHPGRNEEGEIGTGYRQHFAPSADGGHLGCLRRPLNHLGLLFGRPLLITPVRQSRP